MAFGSKRKLADRSDIKEDDTDDVDLINSDDERNSADEQDESAEHGTAKPAKSLLDEVFFLDAPKGKNSGGSRPWRCKHCDKKYTSSYTRIHQHFFGVGPGKTKQIARCSVASDRIKYSHGVSVVSDGWTNMKNHPLINVIASNSRGSMFLYAEDFSGEEKTGEAIAQFLLQAIEEIGPSNVLQVITDNASNCRVAGEEIQKVHKHIFWSPCVVHTLNLVFKDFAKKFAWMVDTYQTGKAIVKFFRNHQHFQDLFRRNSKLDLLKVSKTRFASHYIVLKRLMDVQEALTTTIVTSKWKELVKSCDVQTRAAANAIAQNIIDETFWDEIKIILDITKPLYMVIKFSDGEGPKSGDIYERMDNMLGEMQEVMTREDNPHKDDWSKVNEIILYRWGKMNWHFHCLAFALSPKYYDQAYLASPAPGGGQRKAPNDESEVMEGVIEALNRIAEDKKEYALLREELNTFIMKKGLYAIDAVQADAATMNATEWWFNYGSQTPTLSEVAKKVLSQPISSSSAERNWSTYSFIHNVKRNKLNATTADKLVFIHANERLKRRFSEGYNSGPHYKWDVEPENDLLEDSSLKLEQLRWDSLEDDHVLS
ncbi:hypothetical protein D1007_31746 [Hordeum vulgare]|nr:hypothetical protein D1007_31746 [Hordeum vulgare]